MGEIKDPGMRTGVLVAEGHDKMILTSAWMPTVSQSYGLRDHTELASSRRVCAASNSRG